MKLGRQIQLNCDVTADPPIDVAQIRWLSDAVASGYVKTNRKYTLNTQPSSGIHKHAESILTINKISADELGRYSCEARNSAGMYRRVSVRLSLGKNPSDYHAFIPGPGKATIGVSRVLNTTQQWCTPSS